jgi:RNA polymerase sigma-70 factor (ECF subfamily)
VNESELRIHWAGAFATVTRLVGDLGVAEDAVQDACAEAVRRWPIDGSPHDQRAWLVGVARHKAIDRIRREARRDEKEAAAMRALVPSMPAMTGAVRDEELALVFMCCHPALDPAARVALTLRCVCGLRTSEIAAAFLVPEATMAKRIARAKRKIRDGPIRFRVLEPHEIPDRLAAVLRVVYLVFTEDHRSSSGPDLVRDDLCDAATRLARTLVDLVPDEPEAAGLLALLLFTDARRAARAGPSGELVLLEEQDRSSWNHTMIAEGDAVLERALRRGRPGSYQIHAAIAACHANAPTAADTDWRQIAALYGELIPYEPTAVIEANRAIAVAMAEGPAAGLVILDAVAHHPQLARWPSLHVARADLLRRLGRDPEAIEAYRQALELERYPAERAFVRLRIDELTARS